MDSCGTSSVVPLILFPVFLMEQRVWCYPTCGTNALHASYILFSVMCVVCLDTQIQGKFTNWMNKQMYACQASFCYAGLFLTCHTSKNLILPAFSYPIEVWECGKCKRGLCYVNYRVRPGCPTFCYTLSNFPTANAACCQTFYRISELPDTRIGFTNEKRFPGSL